VRPASAGAPRARDRRARYAWHVRRSHRAPPEDVGVRLIVLYKAVKAVGEVALALGLVALAATGEIDTVREVARALRQHVASRWSVVLGRALASVASPHGLHLAELALLLDGALSALEGWSLWRSYSWGPWLVVAATALPLPLEIRAIVRTHRLSRVALVLANLAVVAYLGLRSLRRARAQPADHP
jgi:uncharacterized membrane protein (DUF2068 family)